MITVTILVTKLSSTYVVESTAESLKDAPHVAAFLHGDDAGVILFVHPDQEILVDVVPKFRQKVGSLTIKEIVFLLSIRS